MQAVTRHMSDLVDIVGALRRAGVLMPPTIAAAAEKSQGVFVTFVLLHLCLMGCLRAFLGRKRPRSTSDLAQSGQEGSPLADVLSYNAAALVYACYVSYVGVTAWFDGSAAALGGSVDSRMYGYSREMELLGIATTAYELYNVGCTIIMPEYRTVAFIGHHVTTFILGVMSFHPWLHYYAIFFFGVASSSSIPLCWGEVFHAVGWPLCHQICQGIFALFFLAIRTIYWPIVSFGFWRDSLFMLSGQGPVPVHSTFAYCFLLAANIGLTSLQFLWTGQILSAIKNALGGGAAQGKKED